MPRETSVVPIHAVGLVGLVLVAAERRRRACGIWGITRIYIKVCVCVYEYHERITHESQQWTLPFHCRPCLVCMCVCVHVDDKLTSLIDVMVTESDKA